MHDIERLVISHGCWTEDSGTVLDFMRWRALLARAAGYGTAHVLMGEHTFELPDIPYDTLTEENVLGDWGTPPADPLMILLGHSDTEGVIHHQDAMPLALRLRTLVEGIAEHSHYSIGSPLQHIEETRTWDFARGLLRAHEAEEDVTFQGGM